MYPKLPMRIPNSIGFKRYAMYFDGVDDYVEVAGLEAPTPFTVSVYFMRKGSGTGGVPRLITTSPTDWGIEFGVGNTAITDKLGFYLMFTDGTSTGWVGVLDIKNNIWYYAVLSFDGTWVRVYVNGNEVYSNDEWAGKTVNNLAPIDIGGGPGSDYFNGVIALVCIYNRALSENEIRYNMLDYENPVRDGLVLWLHDRIVGDTWYDDSGNGNDGTINGATKENLRAWEIRSEVGL